VGLQGGDGVLEDGAGAEGEEDFGDGDKGVGCVGRVEGEHEHADEAGGEAEPEDRTCVIIRSANLSLCLAHGKGGRRGLL